MGWLSDSVDEKLGAGEGEGGSFAFGMEDRSWRADVRKRSWSEV